MNAPPPAFYGWRMVYACLAIASLAWGFGLFGAGVYLKAVHAATGLSIAAISTAVSLSFICSACAQVAVGRAVGTYGPARVMGWGGVCLGAGVAIIGCASSLVGLYAGFLAMGAGWACLSTTAISTTLAPWFDRYQGRAVSTAMLGASVGGMVGPPLLLYGVAQFGRSPTLLASACVIVAIALPLACFVLKRSPAELGLHPDGLAPVPKSDAAPRATMTRAEILRSWMFRSSALGFGLAQCVMVGFLTHHVSMLVPALGATMAGGIVTATALAAFAGRLALARYSDGLDARRYTVILLILSSVVLAWMGMRHDAVGLVSGSLAYGLMLGNITTMAPIVIRREFGATGFGPIYGAAATAIALLAACGPTLYGVLVDLTGTYRSALAAATLLNVGAAILLHSGSRRGRCESPRAAR